MLRADYFKKALASGLAKNPQWVISVLSIVNEGPDDWKKNPYPYRIVRNMAVTSYVSPEDNSVLIPIKDSPRGEALFVRKDTLELIPGELPNLKEKITTSIGNALCNWLLLVYPFGDKIPYINGRFSVKKVEAVILKRLVDDPPEGQNAPPDKITVSEYLKFTDAAFYLPAFSHICIPSDTERSLGTDPRVAKRREELLKEYSTQLHDPAIIAKIQAELIAMDKEWLKGDPSEGFLHSSSMRNVVRPRMYLMFGSETGFGDGVTVENVASSLEEGWEVDKVPVMVNTLRSGQYNRGQETQLGGEAVKWLLRVSSNIGVTEDDCGSKLGMRTLLNDSNFMRYLGFHIATNNGPVELTEGNIKQYLGKVVMIRSPMYCRLPNTDYCKCCVGPRLTVAPFALSSAVSNVGSRMLYLFMKAMHGKSLETARLDITKVFS